LYQRVWRKKTTSWALHPKEKLMNTDNGNWLSAEQAVLPDGTERVNLPLVKKKLPLFSPEQASREEPQPTSASTTTTPPPMEAKTT
jgi:hypothetical protein